MNKKSASIFLAVLLDLFFACFFLFALSQWKANEEIILYMNQVGMFKENVNAEACMEKLKNLNLDAYRYQKDDLQIVVTSLTLNEKECIENQKILQENGFSYVLKNVASSGKDFVEAVNQKKYQRVMELMSN